MENNKKNVLNNQPNDEEKKKKKSIADWWRNLGKGARTAICILGGVAVATAVIVPTVIAAKSCAGNKTSAELADGVTGVKIESTKTLDNGNFQIILKVDAGKELESVEKITIGNAQLTVNVDYTLTDNVIVINKDVIEKHKGEKIIITAKTKTKEDVKDLPEYLLVDTEDVGEGNISIKDNSGATFPSDLVLDSYYKVNGEKKKVVKIASRGFENNTNFSTLTLPDTLITIGGLAFNNCCFNSLEIPSSVTLIDEAAFKGMINNLQTVVFKDSTSTWNVVRTVGTYEPAGNSNYRPSTENFATTKQYLCNHDGFEEKSTYKWIKNT